MELVSYLNHQLSGGSEARIPVNEALSQWHPRLPPRSPAPHLAAPWGTADIKGVQQPSTFRLFSVQYLILTSQKCLAAIMSFELGG